MDNYIKDLLDEVLARQAEWRKQAELDMQAAEAHKALPDNLSDSWRYRLGQRLISVGEWLSQKPETRQSEV